MGWEISLDDLDRLNITTNVLRSERGRQKTENHKDGSKKRIQLALLALEAEKRP